MKKGKSEEEGDKKTEEQEEEPAKSTNGKALN